MHSTAAAKGAVKDTSNSRTARPTARAQPAKSTTIVSTASKGDATAPRPRRPDAGSATAAVIVRKFDGFSRLATVESQLIFQCLPPKTRLQLARCCHLLHHVARGAFAWRHATPPLKLLLCSDFASLHRCLSSPLLQHAPLRLDWGPDEFSIQSVAALMAVAPFSANLIELRYCIRTLAPLAFLALPACKQLQVLHVGGPRSGLTAALIARLSTDVSLPNLTSLAVQLCSADELAAVSSHPALRDLRHLRVTGVVAHPAVFTPLAKLESLHFFRVCRVHTALSLLSSRLPPALSLLIVEDDVLTFGECISGLRPHVQFLLVASSLLRIEFRLYRPCPDRWKQLQNAEIKSRFEEMEEVVSKLGPRVSWKRIVRTT